MNKEKKHYLVACSGGPDSMALLDMYKDKHHLMCCHINYHKRETADRDEKIVKAYCKKNNIPFIKFNYVDKKGGNFQDKARVFRYKCFADIINKYHLDAVLVGHHLDDLLETYLMQLERNSGVSYFGLNKSTTIMNVKVIRPLLKYTKNDLIEYCQKNNIIYGIDESNLTNVYKRNKIRHEIIEKLTKSEKKKLLKEIKYKNLVKKEDDKKVRDFISTRTKFNYEEFMSCPYIKDVLRKLIKSDLSDKHLDEIIKALKAKRNVELSIGDKTIYKEYDYIEFTDKPEDYCYTFKKIEYKKYQYFKFTKKGTSFEGATLKKEDFPITVRNYHEGDSIKMLYGTKKINRFFIDKKIPSSKRRLWPIMLDAKGNAILVPEIGCNVDHYSTNHNVFMLKLI